MDKNQIGGKGSEKNTQFVKSESAGEKMSKKELTKDELMKQVLGKKREIVLPSFDENLENTDGKSEGFVFPEMFGQEALEQEAQQNKLISNQAELIKKQEKMVSELSKDDNSLEETLKATSKSLDDIAQEIDISKLKAEIEKDFGAFPSGDISPLNNSVLNDSIPEKSGSSAPSQHTISSGETLWADVKKENVPEKIDEITTELKKSVLGQDDAIQQIAESFFRPYLQKEQKNDLRNVVYISGARGTGKHFLFHECLRVINGNLVSNTDCVTLDMSDYQEVSKRTVFLQDIYSALVGDKPFILLENFNVAHASVNSMVGELVKNGKIKLDKRYYLKNGVLTQSDKTLREHYISEIDGNQKFIVFISVKSESELLKVYGKDVQDKVLDVVKTKKFSREVAENILQKSLSDTKEELESALGANVEFDTSAMMKLLEAFETFNGVHSFLDILEELKLKILDNIVRNLGLDIRIFYEQDGWKMQRGEEIAMLSSPNLALQSVKKEIAQIVGLDDVKEYLYSLEDLVNAGTLRRKMGLKSEAVSRHMIFTGNPGTGKTTIARLTSKLMKSIGALKQGHLVEVSRADLVGRYSGHTAPLTMSVIKSALGGVLFIDEAYSLYRGKDDAFGLEAIDTLVKGMEDNRDNLMVVLAGYSDEMEVFLSSNSGLKSRFPKIIHFEDYDAEDLLSIALIIAKKKDYIIDEAVIEPLKEYLGAENLTEKSNGRLARNIVEAAIIKQSGRITGQETAEEMRTLVRKDFDF